jgi:hypothetical protein
MATVRYQPASRKNLDHTADPYIPRKGAPSVGVCPLCHIICRKKRWYEDKDESASLIRSGAPLRRCPACRKIVDGFPSGVLTLRGGFLRFHREEILKIARNEERRARGINPLERIMEVRGGADCVEVLTTDGKLAQRIGREVRKAYQGSVRYKWSEDADLLRVTWSRDA